MCVWSWRDLQQDEEISDDDDRHVTGNVERWIVAASWQVAIPHFGDGYARYYRDDGRGYHVNAVERLEADDRAVDPWIERVELVQGPKERCLDQAYAGVVYNTQCVLELVRTTLAGISKGMYL